VVSGKSFEDLLAEGASVPAEGWDFSWFEGRASEERPSWGYAGIAAGRMEHADSALDIQTGGGEVLAWILGQARRRPARLAATEGWPPNAALARRRLEPFGAGVYEVADEAALPFDDGCLGLVVSRHPVITRWTEVARVLRPGGTFLSQQVGAGSNRELYEFMMGPQPGSDRRSPQRAAAEAQAAGLVVVDLRSQALRVVFHDIGAVVYFLRKVIWTVPGFTVDAYHDRLTALHQQIQAHGPFATHSQRFLIEVSKPR
jgi:SAM-dependent methyltransferase